MNLAEIQAEALKLSQEDRAHLLHQLAVSLEAEKEPELTNDELQKRWKEFERTGERIEASQLHEKFSVHKMSVEEKLQVMEEIWEDLARNPDDFESPDWHGVELAKRRAEEARGEASYIPWEQAKEELRRRANDH